MIMILHMTIKINKDEASDLYKILNDNWVDYEVNAVYDEDIDINEVIN